jgi:tRNA pseudouridine55 synthase
MDGLLVADKPAGPTSHDVVARVRRALGERRIGHAGTLDPAATGVLVLVLGRATRLARFLSGAAKAYEAVVRLGFATDTYDADGTPTTGAFSGPLPPREAVAHALEPFRGSYLQQPPAYSAKKIDGRRSYQRARDASRRYGDPSPVPYADPSPVPPARPAPAAVTAHAVELVAMEDDRVTLRIECSAGFYVRALAHELGTHLGCGAHLASLRRVRSGDLTLASALTLDAIERDPAAAAAAVVPMSNMLPALDALALTDDGVNRVRHGQDIGAADVETRNAGVGATGPLFVRLLGPGGNLIAIARPAPTSGLLHPMVVLV